jgi:putative ATPase
VLKALEKSDLEKLCHYALESDEILKQAQLQLEETEALLRISGVMPENY